MIYETPNLRVFLGKERMGDMERKIGELRNGTGKGREMEGGYDGDERVRGYLENNLYVMSYHLFLGDFFLMLSISSLLSCRFNGIFRCRYFYSREF